MQKKIRRSADQLEKAAADAAGAALRAAGVSVQDVSGQQAGDVAFRVELDGRSFTAVVRAVAYCTGARAEELLSHSFTPGGVVPLVVADRITADARIRLADAGWSWVDRRGPLHLRGPGVLVDRDIGRPLGRLGAPPAPITGRSGIAVAYWLCAHPGESLSPTKDAAVLGVAPSTISTTVRRLADAGLVDERGAGAFPELFWELADAWPVERTWLAAAPDPAHHRPADRWSPAWRRTGSAAAAAYGAPIVTAEGGPVELYVPGPVDISIAARRYHAMPPGDGAAVVAVAPARAVAAVIGEDRPPIIDGWPAAPLLAVALDLAQDRGRGRQILDEWDAPDAVWR